MTSRTDNAPTGRLHDRDLKRFRLTVQAAFTLFCVFCGYRFYQFYLWASGKSELFVPRPPAIEAFLPISGLVGLKQLLLSGVYDDIHPAGLTIFIAALLTSLLFRKGFCGWICPVGFTSNLAEKLGLKLKILRRAPAWLDIPLLSLKYLLLGLFAFLILVQMDLEAIRAFNHTPYNVVVDAKMLLLFMQPSPLTLWVMGFLVVVSFVSRNFWCRYLCPYGALLGILALASPMRVQRDQERCIDCHKCEKACPGSIRVASKTSINVPECVGCLECVAACPVADCLSV
ncbi:MAG: 4Fe-4S binding protein, partial [Desulfobulbaceae bacterium]|nr:4Fe-4S binding protein [Desulfobulbaceae bacterium]